MSKPKWALFTASGCRGCETLILDVNYQVALISDLADVVFWPFLLGSRWSDLERWEDGSLDVCFLAGAIRTTADEEATRRLRSKAQVLVAFGACACFGGIPALADGAPGAGSPGSEGSGLPGEPTSVVPEGELTLPALCEATRSLDQTVAVDYYVPGCPPPLNFAWATLQAFAGQNLPLARLGFLDMLPPAAAQAIAGGLHPPRGTFFAGEKAVCATCSRVKDEKQITAIRRPYEIVPDPERCLLEQGIVCCGIATRGGCGGRCTALGLPCRGCFGPAEKVLDPGAKLVAAIASTIASDDPTEIAKISDGLIDLLGTFYRYSLPKALLSVR